MRSSDKHVKDLERPFPDVWEHAKFPPEIADVKRLSSDQTRIVQNKTWQRRSVANRVPWDSIDIADRDGVTLISDLAHRVLRHHGKPSTAIDMGDDVESKGPLLHGWKQRKA